jgi:acetate---CoA ligase (ADP-forming)
LEEALTVAARVRYPVVLKAQSPELAHKTDIGGVILGVADDEGLASAWDRLHRHIADARPGLVLDGVLVEAMARPGLEMVLGGRRDPDWGPVVMVGLGGVWVEVLRDVRLMPADAGRTAVAAELDKLHAAALLRGVRGQPPVDVEALIEAAVRIGALLRRYPAISEIDLNPLVVYPKGQGALALDVLLVTREQA